MDRTLVVDAPLALALGHRLEVTERWDEPSGASTVAAVVDLDTGVRYVRAGGSSGEVERWLGRVVECTVTFGERSARTVLTVAAESVGGANAKAALRGADAAADAAKAEADRWGGADREPREPVDRVW